MLNADNVGSFIDLVTTTLRLNCRRSLGNIVKLLMPLLRLQIASIFCGAVARGGVFDLDLTLATARSSSLMLFRSRINSKKMNLAFNT